MATKQEFLDDLERRGLVRVTAGPDGTKSYTLPPTMSPPPYYCQPYIPETMSPDQWGALVLENFTNVFLTWWTGSFQAARDATPAPQAMVNTVIPVYNPDTELWETQVVPIAGS